MLNDGVGNGFEIYFQIFGAIHRCVEVKIFDIDGHEACAFGRDDTVKEDFCGKHVGHGCAVIVREDNPVASNSEADVIWVIFFRS